MRTALAIVPVDLPAAVEELYAASNREGAARGIPLHVTLLFPWVPREQLGDEQRARAHTVLTAFQPFELALTRLDSFEEVLWAAPEPAERVRALIATLADAFPEHPPYEGAFDEVIPHATLAHVEPGTRDEAARALRAELDPLLPVTFPVDDVAVLEEHATERWRVRERLPLGGAA